jgi:hypothetical protein
MSPTKQAKSQWRQRRREAKKATVARNQNSISDRMEKKTLGEPRLSQGASPPLANEPTVYDYELGSIMSGVRCDQNFHNIYPVHLVGLGHPAGEEMSVLRCSWAFTVLMGLAHQGCVVVMSM